MQISYKWLGQPQWLNFQFLQKIIFLNFADRKYSRYDMEDEYAIQHNFDCIKFIYGGKNLWAT